MATVSDPSAPAGVGEPVVPTGAGPAETVADLAVAGWLADGDSESKSDRYLARRLAAASADFKSVALTTFVLAAAVCGGAWLALGVLVEHWLVPGGLAPGVRWAWLATAGVALAAAAIRWLVPLVRYRVNLVYAARAIEREHPELHNDLVNTVLVKAHPEANPAKVVRSLERRTAKQLADVPVEAVIDRTVPLRLAYVLAALVGLAGLYELAAPKSLLVSAARLLAPWVGWAAPSRVRIEPPQLAWRMPAEQGPLDDVLDRRRMAVEAGAATLVRGRQLVVAADIRGLRAGEQPEILVAPLRGDGSVDPAAPAWRTELGRGQAGAGRQRLFTALLPDAARGLDHSVEITIVAGDARTAAVRVAVVDSPTLLVREIRYAYPAYTRRPPEAVAWQGDIRAVEGTEATIVAESNQPLEDAWIDFDGDGGRDMRFTKSAADLARVTKSFHLHRKADGTGPEHASYRLLFQPRAGGDAGREGVITDAMEHRIEVLADLAPEVAIETPRESPLRVPPAAPVAVRVQAHDPDFALARVAIETRLQGGAAGAEIVLLEQEQAGVFRGTAELVPERLGAGPGATLEYRAVAIDNRPKRPNAAHSPWQALRIDPAAPPRQPEPPPAGRGKPDDARSGEQPGEKDKAGGGGGNQAGQQPRPENGEGEPERNQAADAEQQGKQDGQAQGAQNGDREQAAPQGGKQAGDQQGQGQNQGQGAEQGQGVGAQGERQGGQQQPGKQGPGSEQAGGKQPGGAQQGGQQSGGQQGGSQPRGGEPGAGKQAGGEKQAGGAKQAGGDKQAGGERAGDQPQGGNESGGAQPGGKPQGGQRGARDSAVAADGTNDGEAMERILEHRREQGAAGQGAGKEGTTDPKGAQQGDAASGAQGEQPGDRPGEQGDGGSAGAGEKPGPGKGTQGQPGQGEAGQGKPDQGKPDQGKGDGQGGASDGQGTSGGGDPAAGQGQPAGEAADGTPKSVAGDKDAGEKSGGGKTAGEKGAGEKGGGEQAAGGDGQQGAGGKQGEGAAGAGQPGAAKSATAGQPGKGAGEAGSGGWAGGDAANRADGKPLPDGPPPAKETEWGEQDLANARNAADLAIEYLRKAVDAGDTAVLERLGWTADQAQAFLDRWQSMRRLAESADPIERGEFERAVRSLGLRPDGVRSSRDVPSDARGGQAEGRRSRPPADYQEQFKAYTQGTAGE